MADNNWVDVLDSGALPEDDVIGVEVQGRDIAIYECEGAYFATDNICTHGHARLCDGFLEDGEIECPLHQGRFDIRTGKALCEPLTEDIRSYPVKVEQGRVWLQLEQ
ncbi:non-heme iron oxygenase ferredoxin subunit [Neopusillimonas maritima]|jgi:naphthalene 1,2-dioxygenase system ferredoxin subunit|uniref:Naphthalene 1,2-dioxygenase n=1 Tax=Neopusillimonas maritima TaxID=2026239 RepID=A0A3A1YYM9_9BURK|nr:non-heme iron oxygenase ferredoxin subunit [Neopusillimonas maritima]RIY42288.1 naphthalene 1,2-dioxygenase [Neopusillimonas maritima]|tara:strand:- start:79 stop:399 length:321 start_codon:yes stop_codon:yes gene_type:complete